MAGSFGRARRQIAKNADRAWSIRARRQLGTALGCAWLVMTRYLALRLLLGLLLATSVSVRSSEAASYRDTIPIVKVGLVLEESSASPAEATADETQSCERVSFCRAPRNGRRENDLPAGSRKPVARRSPGCRGSSLVGPTEHRPVRRKSRGDRGRRLLRRRIPCGEFPGPPGISGARFQCRRGGAGVG